MPVYRESKQNDLETFGSGQTDYPRTGIHRENITDSMLRGPEIEAGSGDDVMKFNEEKGLWLGHSEFDSAPFSVDMKGNVTAVTLDLSWDNLEGIPDRLTDSPTTGLNLTPDYLGFYDGTSFQSYIDKDGNFQFRGDDNNKIVWDADTGNLIVSGSISVQNASSVRSDINVANGADVTSNNPQNVDWLTDAGAMAYYDKVEKAMEDETIIVGGYIDTSFLTADNITTGTLEAIKVRTSASGGRVVLDDGNDSINIYDSGGIRMSLQEETLTFLDPNGYSGAELSAASSNELWIKVGTDSYYFRVGNLNMGGSALANVGNIGASYTRAGTFYGTDMDLSGEIDMNNNNINGAGTVTVEHLGISSRFVLGDEPPAIDGAMYYRSSDAKIRVRLDGTWYSLATEE